jgi:hypothetical protein
MTNLFNLNKKLYDVKKTSLLGRRYYARVAHRNYPPLVDARESFILEIMWYNLLIFGNNLILKILIALHSEIVQYTKVKTFYF